MWGTPTFVTPWLLVRLEPRRPTRLGCLTPWTDSPRATQTGPRSRKTPTDPSLSTPNLRCPDPGSGRRRVERSPTHTRLGVKWVYLFPHGRTAREPEHGTPIPHTDGHVGRDKRERIDGSTRLFDVVHP